MRVGCLAHKDARNFDVFIDKTVYYSGVSAKISRRK